MPRAHVTTGYDCWCDPVVEQRCDACDGDGASCWRCQGAGWHPCPAPEHYDGPCGLLIVHQDVGADGGADVGGDG